MICQTGVPLLGNPVDVYSRLILLKASVRKKIAPLFSDWGLHQP